MAFITTYLHLTGKWEEYRRCGCHLVATGGKSHMVYAVLLAQAMNIPTYFVFDSDSHNLDKGGKHTKDNIALLKLAGMADPDPHPKTTCWAVKAVMWDTEIGLVVENEIGKETWLKCSEAAEAEYGQLGNLQKNPLRIAATLTYAWNGGKRSPSLDRLCSEIVGFANPSPGVVSQLAAKEE